MALPMHLLHRGIVGVLVRNEERSFNRAAIWIIAALFENLFVNIDIVVVDGIIECDHDHLWHLCWLQFARDLCAVW